MSLLALLDGLLRGTHSIAFGGVADMPEGSERGDLSRLTHLCHRSQLYDAQRGTPMC